MPQPGNLIDRVPKMADAGQMADELFLALLTRQPTADERADAAEYLAKNSDRGPSALANLAWALLTSTEFFVNH